MSDLESQIITNNPNYFNECYCDTNNNDILDPLEITNLQWSYSESEETNYLTGISLIYTGHFIDSIPTSIQNVKTLERVTISNSNMVTIPSEIFTLPLLRSINLYNNNISELPDLFYQLDSTISIINFSGNNLTEIPNSILEINNLEHINFNNNQISSLPDNICELNSNIQISLTENAMCLRENVPDCYEDEIENQTKCYSELDLNGIQAIIDSNNVTPEICECDLNLNGNIEAFEFGDKSWQPWTENARLTEAKFSNIYTIPKVAFENLTSLEKLILADNSIDTIFNEIENLSSLIELDLDNNILKSIPDVMLNQLDLRNLSLDGNDSLVYLPNLFQLDELNISNTNLFCENGVYNEDLLNEFLNNGVHVNGAFMQYCYMQPDLEFILEIINGNGIFYEWQELGSQVWDEGRLIEFEILNEAAIDLIPNSIGNLSEIQNLEISNSNILEIPIEIENLVHLTSLKLNNNILDTIGFDISGFQNLQYFDFSSNDIYKFPESVCEIPIIEIHFESNRICEDQNPPCPIINWDEQILTQRCKNVGDIQFIEDLISQNGLEYDYYNFGFQEWQEFDEEEMDRLTTINHLRGTHSNDTLTSIPLSILNVNYLENIQFENHKIASIPNELFFLDSLKELNLSSNEINILSESINAINGILKLNLSQNQLTSIPNEIGELESLIELDLSANEIDSLPNSIGNLTDLEILNISDNSILQIPENLENLINLTTFDISGNELDSLPSIWCDELQIEWDNPNQFNADDNKLCDDDKIPSCILINVLNQNCD